MSYDWTRPRYRRRRRHGGGSIDETLVDAHRELLLLLRIVFIVQNRRGFFHKADGIFGITVVSLMLARYLDIRFCKGLTATGAPASMTT
jgi:hypothetical protein